MSVSDIAKKFNRTPIAIERKARKLKLGKPSIDSMTLGEFARHSGFSEEKIQFAMKILGIKIRRRFATYSKTKYSKAYAITASDRAQILEFMLNNKIAYRNKPGDKKTQAGVWGIGTKPESCLICNENAIPHYARGMCRRCYMKERKKTG